MDDDFTYVSSWQGMVYVAFVINVFRAELIPQINSGRPSPRKIVGWRVSTLMTSSFVLDALNQVIFQRAPSEVGINTSVGSVGDSYDNSLTESIFGLFKTDLISFLGPWKSGGQVEWETLKWVNWYATERHRISHATRERGGIFRRLERR